MSSRRLRRGVGGSRGEPAPPAQVEEYLDVLP